MTSQEMAPVLPDIPEPKSAWEWITGGTMVGLAMLAGIARWLRRAPESPPPSIAPAQLDRIEALQGQMAGDIRILCNALTTYKKDGTRISASVDLAAQLDERLGNIERKLETRRPRREET